MYVYIHIYIYIISMCTSLSLSLLVGRHRKVTLATAWLRSDDYPTFSTRLNTE